MKPSLRFAVPALAFALLGFVGCATSAPPVTQPTAARTRRRRRPRPPAIAPAPSDMHVATADSDAGVPLTPPSDGGITARARPTVVSDAFGTPVVARPPAAARFTPSWVREGRRQVLRCVGEPPPQLPSSQSAPEPSIASVVRAFHPVERNVAACGPPSTPNGRLPVRGIFYGSGIPREFTFPQMTLTEPQAMCVGRYLCDLRLPVFRSINAPVSYDYVVYLPATE